ncbi:PREDICTED: ankyrin-1-like [Ceratosolen solmsi marchali]|uniref:Ankyrin-1-like n=1 Tax=Ceratosolen solmsi marchali TaxID=326594 RepID=A0AAJ6YD09_9HYME|nr:PREDICTED: ankyrin-1-like [Ceratosolen solmsi marchali]
MADHNDNQQDDNVLLHLSVIEENLDVAKFLLKHGVPVNGRAVNKELALEFLTDSEHRSYLESIRVSQKSELLPDDELDAKTTTALHLASRIEIKDIAELLLQMGAEVNSEMQGGETPLIIAVLSKRMALVQLLLDRGADVNAKTLWGKSALHYAAQTGQKPMLEMLLRRGGHVNASDRDGLTPLHIAAEAGHKELVFVLLKGGADYEVKSKSGATALHYAAVMGHQEILETILDNGASINSIIKHGMLDLAPFTWITDAEEKKTWELVSRYISKVSLVGWWYNSTMMRLYGKHKTRKSIFHADMDSH